MDELVKQALLYDYYGELLTDQQKKIYEEVFFDDYSLSEVAKDENISRQGVHDMIKRTKQTLQSYEDKLGLVKKHLEIKEIASKIEEKVSKAANGDKLALKQIEDLSKKLQNI